MKEKIKKRLTKVSQRLLRSYSFTITGIPEGLVCLDEAIYPIYPAEPITYLPPITLQDYHHPVFPLQANVHHPKPERMLIIDQGVATAVGGNLTHQGKLISTFLHPKDGKKLSEHELFYFQLSRCFPKTLKIKGTIASLTDGWQQAFYHWIYQVIPRLGLLSKPYPLLYIDQSCEFQKQTLDLLQVPKQQIIDASVYAAVEASELIIPEPLIAPRHRSCHFLKESFISKLHTYKKRRLYLSRKDAKTRRIQNEKEILPILEQFGFETLILSDLPLLEQMAQLHAAEMVVAPHGAGLSHLVFCHPHTAVLELFHINYFNSCYWQICCLCDLDYYVLFDHSTSAEKDPDMMIDPDLLYKSLKAMEHDRPYR